MNRAIGRSQSDLLEMPTPLPNNRTISIWTLGDPLGAGGQGRVFFGSNASGDVAAIKFMERTSRNRLKVAEEIETLQKVTKLADKSDECERIMRMLYVIYTDGKEFKSQTPFDNVAIVLKPMTPQTLADLVGIRSKG